MSEEIKTCEYPHCEATELNEWNMCSEHAVHYPPGKGPTRSFDLKYIQDGLKRLAAQAKEEQDKTIKNVQEHLL